MVCKNSEFNKTNNHRNVPENMEAGKTVDANKKLGMSEDFPFTTGFQQFFKGSKSVWSTEKRPSYSTTPQNTSLNSRELASKGGAGLTVENSMHNVAYFNGNKSKPQVFANLLNNTNKHDLKSWFVDEDRFKFHEKFKPKFAPKRISPTTIRKTLRTRDSRIRNIKTNPYMTTTPDAGRSFVSSPFQDARMFTSTSPIDQEMLGAEVQAIQSADDFVVIESNGDPNQMELAASPEVAHRQVIHKPGREAVKRSDESEANKFESTKGLKSTIASSTYRQKGVN